MNVFKKGEFGLTTAVLTVVAKPRSVGEEAGPEADRRLLPPRVAKITVIGQEITLLDIRMV
jgi:hypothetical protein